jgi:hypothetical protein
MDEPRDSEDGTVEKKEVMAGQSDAHASNERPEGYGVRHHDRRKDSRG